MNVFAISDLHLASCVDKPMGIFGAGWERHHERIADAWHERVGDDDLVLLPGDFSWAMRLDEAMADIDYLEALPGKKVMIRGNHDYWWNSLAKVRAVLPQSVSVIQNDAFTYQSVHVCGTRGWISPGSSAFTPGDEKLYLRELNRLSLSLAALPSDGLRIAMLHYPPFDDKRRPTGFCELLSGARTDIALYGHLHGRACKGAFEGIHDGVEYRLVSADHIGFKPLLIKSF